MRATSPFAVATAVVVVCAAALLLLVAPHTRGPAAATASPASLLRRQLLPVLVIAGDEGVPPEVFPLGVCQGDCDVDDDCGEGLRCFQRNSTEAVPGCSGTGTPGADYCVAIHITENGDSSLPELKTVGNNGNPPEAYPLNVCEGDCDSDAECQTGLVCFQRTSESVPGCQGTPVYGMDYCIVPQDSTTDTDTGTTNDSTTDTSGGITTGATTDTSGYEGQEFDLKVFWQDGYHWQEEKFERKWCMGCNNRPDCDRGDRIHLSDCDDGHGLTTQFEFVPQANGAFLIKVASSELCARVPEDPLDPMNLEDCDAGDDRQLYYATNGQAAWGSSFEINPVWAPDSCIGNRHHPKDDETLYAWPCEISRIWTTSRWNFYKE